MNRRDGQDEAVGLSIETREYLEREAPKHVANEVRRLCEKLDTLKAAIGVAHEVFVEKEKGLTKEEWRDQCRSTLENRNWIREQLRAAEAKIAAAIEASDNDGGSASDAIQDMLLILQWEPW
jgi:hypothetical protein